MFKLKLLEILLKYTLQIDLLVKIREKQISPLKVCTFMSRTFGFRAETGKNLKRNCEINKNVKIFKLKCKFDLLKQRFINIT